MTGVVTRLHGRVAEIVMDAPPVNAFSRAFLQALGDAVTGVPARVGAVVVTSSAERVFAAGGDIPYMAGADLDDQMDYVELCQEVYGAFERVPVPTVAAIDGACLGGGLELALSCDVRVVGGSARIGLPEATLGILAGGGAIHRLVRAIGQGAARDLLLTGRRLTGAEAVEIGLATTLTAPGAATATGLDIAARLAAGNPAVTATAKSLALAATDARPDAR